MESNAMKITLTCAIVIFVMQIQPASGSQIASTPVASLVDDSVFIVIGTVEKVERLSASDTYGELSLAYVSVVSTIKGKTLESSFKLQVRVGGLRGFDAPLSEGAQVVFLLRSIESGEARLTAWGSVALLRPDYFH